MRNSKLFKVTAKRKEILGFICDMLMARVDRYGKKEDFGCDGTLRTTIVGNETDKAKAIIKCDAEERKYRQCFETLWIVLHHNDKFLINMYCNGGKKRYPSDDDLRKMHLEDERGWYNEWDVPSKVFNDSISVAIEMLDDYMKKRIGNAGVLRTGLTLLEDLREFRKLAS